MTKTNPNPNPQPVKDRPFAKRFTEPTKTKRYMSADCDINTIMAKAKRGFTVPGSRKQPKFGDFTEIPADSAEAFTKALETVQSAEQSFSELPAKLRDRFNNNPAELLTFLADVNNRAEAVRLGLIEDKKPVSPPPAEKPVVSDSKAADSGVENAPQP